MALRKPYDDTPLSARDTALTTELVYGTLRHKLRLDFLVSLHLKNPEGLPGSMRAALCLGAYELLQLDRVPAYATTHWVTEFVKRSINPKLSKVANAVLRKIGNLGDSSSSTAIYRSTDDNEATTLSRRFSSPLWLVEHWLDAYGPDRTRTFLEASITPPPVGLRFRSHVSGAMERHAELTASSDCIASSPTGVALRSAPEDLGDILAAGQAVRQSYAGQLAMQAIDAHNWPLPVWDACCGRGGKSLYLADSLQGPVFASDPSQARLRGLHQEIQRLDTTSISPFLAKADVFSPRIPLPSILVDAPCSGLGVLARRPDAKLRRTLEDVINLAKVQARILDNASYALACGGVLGYVTCTLTPEENELQIQSFLKRHSNFALELEYTTPSDLQLAESFYAAKLIRTS